MGLLDQVLGAALGGRQAGGGGPSRSGGGMNPILMAIVALLAQKAMGGRNAAGGGLGGMLGGLLGGGKGDGLGGLLQAAQPTIRRAPVCRVACWPAALVDCSSNSSAPVMATSRIRGSGLATIGRSPPTSSPMHWDLKPSISCPSRPACPSRICCHSSPRPCPMSSINSRLMEGSPATTS